MKIAVIGAGNVGGAVARAAVAAGNDVTVSAAGGTNAQKLADEIGATAAASNAAAVDGADVVVLAVPHSALGDVAAEIADGTRGAVVVDATNPLKADYSGLVVTDRSGAEALQEQLPDAHIVKAFNTVFAANQATPDVDGTVLDGFYAGDDADAKAVVAGLLAAIGFRPIDAGPLAAALGLEHMAFVNIALNAGNGLPFRSGWKLIGPVA